MHRRVRVIAATAAAVAAAGLAVLLTVAAAPARPRGCPAWRCANGKCNLSSSAQPTSAVIAYTVAGPISIP